jgi:hypothetical protein
MVISYCEFFASTTARRLARFKENVGVDIEGMGNGGLLVGFALLRASPRRKSCDLPRRSQSLVASSASKPR